MYPPHHAMAFHADQTLASSALLSAPPVQPARRNSLTRCALVFLQLLNPRMPPDIQSDPSPPPFLAVLLPSLHNCYFVVRAIFKASTMLCGHTLCCSRNMRIIFVDTDLRSKIPRTLFANNWKMLSRFAQKTLYAVPKRTVYNSASANIRALNSILKKLELENASLEKGGKGHWKMSEEGVPFRCPDNRLEQQHHVRSLEKLHQGTRVLMADTIAELNNGVKPTAKELDAWVHSLDAVRFSARACRS
eukprot:755796-Hanusia_phi.AAC.3